MPAQQRRRPREANPVSERDSVLSVDDVTNKIRETITASLELQNITVRGELLGFKRHSSGHVYFTILGRESRIACVLFRSNASAMLQWPQDGDEVLVRGRLDIYGARGSYQIYAVSLLPLGTGAKARAKEMLKNRLAQEGLFDVRHKRPLPPFPERVAIITSPTAAALQDVIKISSLRFPSAGLLVVPSLMQGLTAPQEITAAFARCAAIDGLSLVLLVRGGGNRDDLDTFDEESVVRAVRSCPVPVVTGLGHQIDSTLSDLAADFSAPTPSGAAERVFPDRRELLLWLAGSGRSMRSHLVKRLGRQLTDAEDAQRRLVFAMARGRVQPAADFLGNARATLSVAVAYRLNEAEARLKSVAEALHAASPLSILAKGYAICRSGDGTPLRDAASMAVGQELTIELHDGRTAAAVKSISLNEGPSL